MASIIISPTSASFSESGGSGSISLTVETANWHTTPQSGDIWMAQRKRTDGVWSSWVVFRIVGEKGDTGDSSPTMLFQGVFNVNPKTGESEERTYYGGTDRVDIVKYGEAYYKAKSNVGSFHSASWDSTKWETFGASFESVATGLFFADRAKIENAEVRILRTTDGTTRRVVVEGNTLTMYDDNNNQKLLVTGENLGNLSDSVVSKSLARNSVDATSPYTSIVSTITLLSSSNFTITDVGNTVELPDYAVDIYKAVGSNYLNASASLLIDDVVVASSPTYNGTTGDRHTYLVIPSTSLTLGTGGHTLKLRINVTGTGLTTATYGVWDSQTQMIQSSGSMAINYNCEKVQIGGNGFRAAFSATQYAEFSKTGSTVSFVIRHGNYGFRVSSSGVQKSSNMGDTTPSWSNL